MTCEEYVYRHGVDRPVVIREAIDDLLNLSDTEYEKLQVKYWGKDPKPQPPFGWSREYYTDLKDCPAHAP
jgi:hypothetical protein